MNLRLFYNVKVVMTPVLIAIKGLQGFGASTAITNVAKEIYQSF